MGTGLKERMLHITFVHGCDLCVICWNLTTNHAHTTPAPTHPHYHIHPPPPPPPPPASSEHRWLVKALLWIHNLSRISRGSGREVAVGARDSLWRQKQNLCEHRFSAIMRRQWRHGSYYHRVVFVGFVHLATVCGINAKCSSGLDSDGQM